MHFRVRPREISARAIAERALGVPTRCLCASVSVVTNPEIDFLTCEKSRAKTENFDFFENGQKCIFGVAREKILHAQSLSTQ